MTTLYSGLSKTAIEIAGVGIFLPHQRVSNEDIYQEMRERGQAVEKGPGDWIAEKTGIRERRKLDDSAATSDMCICASRDALKASNVLPADVDCLIIGTNSPDYSLPSTGLMVRDSMGMEHAFVLDLNQDGCCAIR